MPVDRARRPLVPLPVVVLAVALAGCSGDDDPPAGGTLSPRPTSVTPTATPTVAPSEPPAAGVPSDPHEFTLDSDGTPREVLLDVPDDHDGDRPAPLIVVLHGAGQPPSQIRSASQLAELSQERGVLVAYPQGTPNWRITPRLDTDVEFLRELVDHLVTEWNVAPGEVYVAGLSNGASMAFRLALDAPDTFAAVAPVSGVLHEPADWVDPAMPVSVVGFVGLRDGTVVSAESLAHWRDRLGCAAGPPEPVAGDDRVTRIDAACPDGSEVVEYRLAGMGHVWPTADRHGLSASEAMWEIFAASAR